MSETRTTHPSSVDGNTRLSNPGTFMKFARLPSNFSHVRFERSYLYSGASISPLWPSMPSRTGSVRLSPLPHFSSVWSTRTDCALCMKVPAPCFFRRRASSASPVWPHGVWPMSWPMAIASMRSSLSRRHRPIDRAMRDTICTCSERREMWSFFIWKKTCVLSMYLANACEWMMRSASCANGVRKYSWCSFSGRRRHAAGSLLRSACSTSSALVSSA